MGGGINGKSALDRRKQDKSFILDANHLISRIGRTMVLTLLNTESGERVNMGLLTVSCGIFASARLLISYDVIVQINTFGQTPPRYVFLYIT